MKLLPQIPRSLVLLLATVLVAPSSFAVTESNVPVEFRSGRPSARAHNGATAKKAGKSAKTATRASVRSGVHRPTADVAVRGA